MRSDPKLRGSPSVSPVEQAGRSRGLRISPARDSSRLVPGKGGGNLSFLVIAERHSPSMSQGSPRTGTEDIKVGLVSLMTTVDKKCLHTIFQQWWVCVGVRAVG